jgi:hypothetical protein
MPPKIAEHSKRLNVIVPEALLKQINGWRRQQDDPPNISTAIRHLIEAGLDAMKKAGKGR